MGRPPGYQWQPLGLDADPVPGDPQAIRAEAAHLKQVASTINGQIAAMRKIASDNTETGQHAEKIRSTALDLAGSLQKVATRYTAVSSALSGWVPELEQAQALSIRALNQAEAPHATLTQAVILPAGPALTAAQEQEIASYHASMQRAHDQLVAAKALLTRAVDLRDTKGAHYAAKINQASDDSLADHESLWGDITHAIASCAWIIKDACTVLELVAAACAIAALCLTGVGWLLVAAFVLTGMALLGRTLLAATGNGSWTDVAVDTVALLTLGVGGGVSGTGGLVGRAGKTLDEAVQVGDRLVTAERAASISGRASSVLARVAAAIDDSPVIPDALARPFASAARTFGDFNETMRPLASAMVKDAEQESAWARIFSGGEDPANYVVRMRMLLDRFPGNPEIGQLSGKFSGEVRLLRGVVGTGVASTVISTTGNGVFPVYGPTGPPSQPYQIGPWDRLEQATTAAVPASVVTDLSIFVHADSVIW
jgi:hypothetical protein